MYTLDLRLQDGKKIYKWEKRSTMIIVMGFSPTHSSTATFGVNCSTRSIGPQFHIIHDEFLTIVYNLGTENMSAL